jgi:tetratricopeptide (TPR) repeat protein
MARNGLLVASGLWCAMAVSQAHLGDLHSVDANDASAWANYALAEARAAAQTIPDAYFRAEALVRIAAVNTSFGNLDAARASLRDAREIANEVKASPGQDLALRLIGLEWARIRDVDAALEAAGAIDMDEMRDPVLVAVINLQIGSGNIPAALANARRLATSVAREQMLRRIAQGQARLGKLSDARATVAAIEDEGMRAIASADVAGALADIGNSDSVAMAIDMASNIHSKSERDAAYVYISLVQAASWNLNDAVATLGRVKEPASRALGFARLATLRAQADDSDNAETLLKRAIAELPRKRAAPGKSVALSEIAVAQIATGQKPAARATLQQALQADGRRPGPEAIARLQARAGDIAGALSTAMQVSDDATHALLIHDITTAQAEAGDVSGARATAQALTDARLQVPAWFGIIGVQTAAGDQVGAKDSVQMAQQEARAIDETEYRAQALAAVAAAHVKLGDVPSGWSSFQEAVATADLIDQAPARSAAFANIAEPFHDP